MRLILLLTSYLMAACMVVHGFNPGLNHHHRGASVVVQRRPTLRTSSTRAQIHATFLGATASNDDKEDEIRELEERLQQLKQEQEQEQQKEQEVVVVVQEAAEEDDDSDAAPVVYEELLSEKWKESSEDGGGGMVQTAGLAVGVLGVVAALAVFSQVPIGQEDLQKYSAPPPTQTIDLGDLNSLKSNNKNDLI